MLLGQRLLGQRLLGQRLLGQRLRGQRLLGQRLRGQRLLGQRHLGQHLPPVAEAVVGRLADLDVDLAAWAAGQWVVEARRHPTVHVTDVETLETLVQRRVTLRSKWSGQVRSGHMVRSGQVGTHGQVRSGQVVRSVQIKYGR